MPIMPTVRLTADDWSKIREAASRDLFFFAQQAQAQWHLGDRAARNGTIDFQRQPDGTWAISREALIESREPKASR